ncbi:hypothetical protein AB1K54_15100 [Microbacterium sp. BWT-B31]|uniref:hypothetical protein n=1 Tax=Microbacterium sp. BWT-B31 TaxID=3232072 RepID=UPI003527E565
MDVRRGWRRIGGRALIASVAALMMGLGGATAGAVAEESVPVSDDAGAASLGIDALEVDLHAPAPPPATPDAVEAPIEAPPEVAAVTVDFSVHTSSVGAVAANTWWEPVPGADRFVVRLSDGREPTELPAHEWTNSLRLTNLTPGVDYRVDIEAWGMVGPAEQIVGRGWVEFTTLASFDLSGVATGPTTVHLTWDPPLADGDGGISGPAWWAPLPAGATEFTDHSVLPGHTYAYELLGQRVEVPVEVGSMSPTVTTTTPTSASFAWPAVYGGATGVSGFNPRTVTYTVFVDDAEVGTTDDMTLDVGGLATAGHRMTIEASVMASFYDETTDEWHENVRVVIARGGVDFTTAPPVAPIPAGEVRVLAESGIDLLPVIVLGGALLAGGVIAAVAASVRPLAARGNEHDRRTARRR